MKIASRDTAGFLKSPPANLALILLYGPDPMRTALTRQDFLKSHLGPGAEEDMRLSRMSGADLRSEPAGLQDATKAIGFFPGPRAVFVEDATDTLAPLVTDALAAHADGDALIVLAAGNLGKGSALRKLAEAAPNAAAIGIYADRPTRASVEDAVAAAGITAPDRDAIDALYAYATQIDPGDFRQLVEKCALYANGAPLDLAAVTACAPASTEEHLDDIVAAAAEGAVARIGPQMTRIAAQGTNPTTLCIATARHFRQLHAVAAAPGGPGEGVARLRPPVFGPRRDRMLRQASGWGLPRLERALTVLMDTDLALRSTTNHPPMAVMERALIRLAMLSPLRS